MRIIIITEKPYSTKRLAAPARNRWPGAEITLLSALPYSNIRFDYPRGLAWADFPQISAPQYRLAPWADWPPHVVGADGGLVPTGFTEADFHQADQVVFACDPDHTGVVSFDILVQQIFGAKTKSFPALDLQQLTEDHIRAELDNPRDFYTHFAARLNYGRAKRYFDWNWNMNALAVLGKTQRLTGLPATAPALSKYALQLLYWLGDQADFVHEAAAARAMDNWTGTGRYAGRDRCARFGSVASRSAVQDNLQAAGLLDRATPPGHAHPASIRVSALGRELLARLHPDCRDPDLPFRLHEWCLTGLPSCQAAMDRYIQTFFGKQKRFLAIGNLKGLARKPKAPVTIEDV